MSVSCSATLDETTLISNSQELTVAEYVVPPPTPPSPPIVAIVSSYTAGLTVTAYELDFFGRVRALSQAAQAQLLGTEEARKTVQISLIASVATTYLNLLAQTQATTIQTQASELASLQQPQPAEEPAPSA